MKSLHIRDVDPAVLERLRKLARLHHRSMQGELRAILTEAAAKAPVSDETDPDQLVTIHVPESQTSSRAEIYGDVDR
ncbi:MAG: Arc family DNA-binding protein [Spirochaetaceae bacterium]|nr:MAG: Arc family DNA-binding protein [Spirochaetaceae bacterium]